jgi:hypothetical protein
MRRHARSVSAAALVTSTRRLSVSESCATRKQIQFIQSFWSTIPFPGEIDYLSSMQVAKHADTEAIQHSAETR